MRKSAPTLPDDPKEQTRLCLSAFEKIERLEREMLWLKRQAFGRKADAVPPPPSPLVQDLFAAEAPPAKSPVPATETVTYERKKPGHGRKAFPAH
jgi:hypothetical protein